MSDVGESGMEEVHGAARDAAGALIEYAVRPPPSRCIFFSMRFGAEHGVVPMAEALRAALAPHGVTAIIINMAAGGDINKTVFEWIEYCESFMVFGSAKYGEDTGNQACTYYEYQHAFAKKKRIILLRMIPFDREFEELQGRVIFGANKLVLPWMVGQPVPLELPVRILELGKKVLPPAPLSAALPTAGLGPPPAMEAPTPSLQNELTAPFLSDLKLDQYTRAQRLPPSHASFVLSLSPPLHASRRGQKTDSCSRFRGCDDGRIHRRRRRLRVRARSARG